MRLSFVILLSLSTALVHAQATPGPDGRMMRDTNAVVYNEQGRIIKYHEYKHLLAKGEYVITFNGDPLLPGTKSILKKLTDEARNRTAQAMAGLELNNGVLSLNAQLDVAPLALALQKDVFSDKA